jgi:hypothetical protein
MQDRSDMISDPPIKSYSKQVTACSGEWHPLTSQDSYSPCLSVVGSCQALPLEAAAALCNPYFWLTSQGSCRKAAESDREGKKVLQIRNQVDEAH